MGLSDGAIAAIFCVVVFVVCCPCLAIIMIRICGNDEEDESKNESTVDDVEEEETEKVRKYPHAIVMGETQSTDDGIETSLGGSFFTAGSEDLEAQQKKRTGRSHDYSAGDSRVSHDTSVSQQSTTVDVHICNSSYCVLCRQKNDGVTFVTAKPLEPKMVGKLQQTGPARWWEFGESFFDLYQTAQANKDNRPAGEYDDEQGSVWGIWSSKSKGIKKKRSLKKVSSDGDEHY
jgi:hypothetical protein